MSDPPDPLLLPPDAVSVPPTAPQSPPPDDPDRHCNGCGTSEARCLGAPESVIKCCPECDHRTYRERVRLVARRAAREKLGLVDGDYFPADATDAAADAAWPLAVEAVKQQMLARKLATLRQREAGIPDGLPPGEAVDALLAGWRARNEAERARQRDAIKAEALREAANAFRDENEFLGAINALAFETWLRNTADSLAPQADDTTEDAL